MKEETLPNGPIGLVSRYELLIILAVAPLMLFPNRMSVLAVVVVVLVWLARRIAYGHFTRPSAMNLPAILLVVMAIIGYLVSVDRQLSEPKLWGIILQVVLFFSVLNGLHGRGDVRWLVAGIVALTAATAALSLIGTQWDVVRLFQLPEIYGRLPQLLGGVPDSGLSPGQEFFHPREVGATMGMLLPFVTAVMLFGRPRWLRLAAVATLILGGIVLLLSQALMGWAGLMVGWVVIIIWWRRWLIAPLLLAGIALTVLLVVAATNWSTTLLALDNPIGLGVVLRLDMWSRSLAMIADMPYTGIGINTFPLIQTHFYIGYLLGPEPHAHNLLLQTAIDLGVTGLMISIWLAAAFYITAWQTASRLEDRRVTALAAGAVASVTSYVTGGTLDVMTLGAKPVAALFIFLGLIGALHWLSQGSSQPEKEGLTDNHPARAATWVVPALMLLIMVASIALRPANLFRNQALISAHKAIFAARQSGRLPEREATQALQWLPNAIRHDPDNPELYGAYGNLLAWRNEPEASLAALTQRMEIDGRNPFAYAPFLAWQGDRTGQSPEGQWETLLRIYRQWHVRFPDRADNHVLMSLVLDQQLNDSKQAETIQQQALENGALPKSLLEYYQMVLARKLAGMDTP